MRKEDWLDRLLKKRFGRLAWVLGLIVGGTGLIALGTKIAIATSGLPLETKMDYGAAIFVGIIVAALLAAAGTVLIWIIYAIIEWIWNG